MNRRALLFFALALAVGVAAAWTAQRWLKGQVPAQQAEIAMISLTVAKVDVAVGTALADNQLSAVEWPKSHLPKGSFSEAKDLRGRVTRRPLVAGELVLEALLLPQGSLPGLVSVISESKRAVSVKVDSIIGVAGFVTPGSRVDVLATLRRVDLKKVLPYSKVILQDILVLAVDQRMETAKGGEAEVVNAVTLEVKPKQAEKLIYSAHEGRLQLALRNPSDRETVDTRSVNVADVFGRPSARGPKVRRSSVQVLKGSTVSVKWF